MTTTCSPSMVGRDMARRAHALGVSGRQVDHWARQGLLPLPLPGSGHRRDWSTVTDRRVGACALVTGACVGEALAVKRRLVDELDRHGRIVVRTRSGRITLELTDDLQAAVA